MQKPDSEETSKKTGKAKPFLAGLLTGVLAAAVAAGVILPRLSSFAGTSLTGTSAVNRESVEKLQTLEKSIEDYYYEPDTVTKEDKEDGMYKGLIESLNDPYSVYYNAKEMDELSQSLSGQYYGIGAYISLDKTTGYPKISGVISGTPAEKAGLQADDIIYKVDDEDMSGNSLEEVVSKVRGEEGTSVHLTVARQGESDYLEFDVTRAKVDSPTVEAEMLNKKNKIAYIRITEFDDVTTDQFEKKLSEMQDEGMKGLVLDLRGNPGGNVDTVTAIAQYFLPEGIVFYMEDKDGKRTDYPCDGKKQLGIPLAVLVDGNSASASEILSGAIKDAGVGTLVGTTTYGKGVVQTVYPFKDGTAVKLTIANYFTRNGNNINKVGIEPDVEVKFDSEAYADGTDNQRDRALEIVQEKLREK